MSIWRGSGVGEWACGYTSLELSGEVTTGHRDLKVINTLMLFSQGTGWIHLDKENRQKTDLKMKLLGL